MTTVFRDGDIAVLIQNTGGVPITVDGVSGFGLMDHSDEILFSDQNRGTVVVGMPTLTIQTSAFPNAKIGSVVVVDGVTYTVRERMRQGDGGVSKLMLGTGEE